MKDSFDSLYERLTPRVKAFEITRRSLLKKGFKQAVVTACAIIAIGLIFLQSLGSFIWVIVGIAVIIGFSIVNYKSGELCAYYKSNIVPLILNDLLPNANYEPSSGISEETFCSCGLFTSPDRYSAEDFISGRIGKTEVCFSETHAEKRHVSVTKNGTREYWTDIFRGFLFIADFHKDFSGRTILYRNSWIKLRFGEEERVKLENKEFERRFDVFSTDAVEARYLLSPSMMERLVAMNDRLGDGITVSFHHSRIHIAIPDATNHFEASVWFSLSRGNLKREFQTISELLQIVEELNLNLRIWTKE